MENLEKMVINEIGKLEVLAWIYSDMLGNDAEEVKIIDAKIRELNMQLLDLMMEEGA